MVVGVLDGTGSCRWREAIVPASVGRAEAAPHNNNTASSIARAVFARSSGTISPLGGPADFVLELYNHQ